MTVTSDALLPKSVFLDCEFSGFNSPRLLSIGLASECGRECYAELAVPTIGRATRFVQDQVIPQFGRIPGAHASVPEIGQRIGQWLVSMGPAHLNVCYDYHTDMDLLESTLRAAQLWNSLTQILQPTHVGYLLGQPLSETAMARSLACSVARDGIGRHHALADARALKAAYLAMHGQN